LQAAKLNEAEMRELLEANVAAERAGDIEATMAFQAPDSELEIAGLFIRGHDEMKAIKLKWIQNWLPRWKDQGWTFGAFDEDKQMAISESWVDNEMDDGSVQRLRSVVVFEFENGKMKKERLYCLDPIMMDVVLETAGLK
jgi:hypothetical protein